MRTLTVLLLLVVSACAPMERANTPSGNAELNLERVRTDCVQSIFMHALTNGGFALRSSTPNQLVFGKRTENFGAAVFLGTRYGGAPEERITALFIPSMYGDGLRVVISHAYVANQGSAFERVTPLDVSQKLHNEIAAFKPDFESRCRK